MRKLILILSVLVFCSCEPVEPIEPAPQGNIIFWASGSMFKMSSVEFGTFSVVKEFNYAPDCEQQTKIVEPGYYFYKVFTNVKGGDYFVNWSTQSNNGTQAFHLNEGQCLRLDVSNIYGWD